LFFISYNKISELQNLKILNAELGHPGVQALWIVAKRSGINLVRKQVEAFVRYTGEKQVFSAVQPSKGKTGGESLDARWHMDLAFRSDSVFLVCVNVLDRFAGALPLKSKEPTNVAEALDTFLQFAPMMPKLITSDNGNEFLGPVSTLLAKYRIAQSFKAVGDVNASGVVDWAIQTLRNGALCYLRLSRALTTHQSQSCMGTPPLRSGATTRLPSCYSRIKQETCSTTRS
jgi:hypothetical protein